MAKSIAIAASQLVVFCDCCFSIDMYIEEEIYSNAEVLLALKKYKIDKNQENPKKKKKKSGKTE